MSRFHKPLTPRRPEHDAACPGCGDPFTMPRLAKVLGAEFKCKRCGQHFFVVRGRYFNTGHDEIPAWVGDPLPDEVQA